MTTGETLSRKARRQGASKNGLTAEQIRDLNESRKALLRSAAYGPGYKSGLGGMSKPPVARVLLEPVTSQTPPAEVAELRELIKPSVVGVPGPRESYANHRRPPAPVYV
jgi:hypothetical protein